jgi:hypothetical protein
MSFLVERVRHRVPPPVARRIVPRPMSPAEIDKDLGDIAMRLGYLKPSSHDPESYHIEKSELLRDLGKLRENIRLGVRV